MHLRRFAAAVAFVAVAACGSSSAPSAPVVPPAEPVVVSFTSPTAAVHTDREAVPLQVYVAVATDRVELLRNGEPFAVLSPPFQFTFFTAFEDEGRYAFVARARVGGAWKESAPLEVWIDRTAPVIAARSPDAGSSWATPLDPITFSFSEPVDPATLEGAVRVSSAALGAVGFAVTLGDDGRTVVVTPQVEFAAEDVVHVEVAGGVRDLAGHPFAGASWSLGVKSFWELLGGGAVGTNWWNAPSLALEPGSRAVLVASTAGVMRLDGTSQTRVDAGPQVLRLASDGADVWSVAAVDATSLQLRRLVSGAWEQVGGDLQVTAYVSDVVILPVDPFGVVVGWIETRWNQAANATTISRLELRRWDGQAWRGVASIDRSGTGSVAWLRGVSGPSGVAYVSYWDAGAHVARVRDDALEPLPTPASLSGPIALATSNMGELFAAGTWLDELRVQRLATGSWIDVGGVASRVPLGEFSPCDLSVDAQGRAVVAWRHGEHGGVRVSRFEGGAWVVIGGVLDVDAARAVRAGPTIALDGSGRPVVAWTETSGAAPDLLFVKRLLP